MLSDPITPTDALVNSGFLAADASPGLGDIQVRRLLEKLPAGAYTCDAEGLITFYNPQAVTLWGRAPQLNNPSDRYCGSFKLFAKDGTPIRHDQCWMALALQNGREYTAQEIIVGRPDGQCVAVLAYASPIHDDTGRLRGAVNVLVDISERKSTEEALRRSEEQMRAVFSSAATGIAILTLRGRFLQVNDAYCQITGYTRDELCALECPSISHPDDLAHLSFLMDELRTGKRTSYELEKRYIKKTGEPVWVIDSVSATRDASGRPTNLVAVCQDITQRKLAEQRAKEASEAAHAANRAKDRFIAVLSHELRTPLSPVVMSLAAMEMDPDIPLRLREDIAMIRRNIDLETKLIDDLLDLSRIASGKLHIRMEPTRLHELLRHIVANCRGDAMEKQLNLRLDAPGRDDLINADPARLQQVLWNIIRNALKFTPEDGRILISTSTPLPGRLRVEVRDSGIGIPPDKLSSIFDAFEQLEPVSARHFGGLGLGLAIAKAVVELHGGSIHAHSDGIGRGTTVIVDLPTIGAKVSTSNPPASDDRHSPGLEHQPRMRAKVLLVEDHPDTAKVLGRLLRVSGCTVSMAASAGAAIELAAKEPFDIVVSDIGLPDATGYELMRQLKSRHGMKGVALSGYGMDEDVQRSRAAGFSEHLVKPINVDTLRSVIVTLCENKT